MIIFLSFFPLVSSKSPKSLFLETPPLLSLHLNNLLPLPCFHLNFLFYSIFVSPKSPKSLFLYSPLPYLYVHFSYAPLNFFISILSWFSFLDSFFHWSFKTSNTLHELSRIVSLISTLYLKILIQRNDTDIFILLYISCSCVFCFIHVFCVVCVYCVPCVFHIFHVFFVFFMSFVFFATFVFFVFFVFLLFTATAPAKNLNSISRLCSGHWDILIIVLYIKKWHWMTC